MISPDKQPLFLSPYWTRWLDAANLLPFRSVSLCQNVFSPSSFTHPENIFFILLSCNIPGNWAAQQSSNGILYNYSYPKHIYIFFCNFDYLMTCASDPSWAQPEKIYFSLINPFQVYFQPLTILVYILLTRQIHKLPLPLDIIFFPRENHKKKSYI